MDVIEQLGIIAFPSRMKRLAERIMSDASAVYKIEEIPFESRWFTMYNHLYSIKPEPASITDIAKCLGISHPAVNQIAGEMMKAKLLDTRPDPNDKRRRMLSLSKKGIELQPQLSSAWNNLRATAQQIANASGYDVLDVLASLERVLDESEFIDRYRLMVKDQKLDAIEIVAYKPELKKYFEKLSRQWIEEEFVLENRDKEMLKDPEGTILNDGGEILFAKFERKVVGTVSLIYHSKDTVELGKLSVDKEFRGKQIGKKLVLAAIEWAKNKKATSLVLETNSRLSVANNLYRKLGFMLVPFTQPSPYSRVDITMKLDLGS